MCVCWSVSNWDLRSHLRDPGLGWPPQNALDSVGFSSPGEGRSSGRSLCLQKRRGRAAGLPPTPPWCCQRERKLGKVKAISRGICKLSYAAGKQTLKIVTWGRPISLPCSLLSLPPICHAAPAGFLTAAPQPCFQSRANILGNARAKSKILWLGV